MIVKEIRKRKLRLIIAGEKTEGTRTTEINIFRMMVMTEIWMMRRKTEIVMVKKVRLVTVNAYEPGE